LQDDPSTELGPLITPQRDRVAGFVERAVAQPHIRLITGGGRDGNGFFFEPTVLADARRTTKSSVAKCSGRWCR
jgi:aminobutyraldehyde dehydrogenase